MDYINVIVVAVILFAALLTSCSKSEEHQSNESVKVTDNAIVDRLSINDIAKYEKSFVNDNTKFAIDVYQRISTSEGNLSFSPYSLSAALAMTYAGARGKTEEEMAHALRFTLSQEYLHPSFQNLESHLNDIQNSGGMKLSIANSLWPEHNYKFLNAYLGLLKEYYSASVIPLDYKSKRDESREAINAWVEGKTQGKIKDLIETGMLDELTRLVLVNAIYFKGRWEHQFEAKDTKNAPYYVSPGKTINHPMMSQVNKFGYAKIGPGHLLEIPYAGGDLSMLVLLPHNKDGLGVLERSLSIQSLSDWKRKIKKERVQVYLPKFEIEQGLRMGQTLRSLGMVDAFDPKMADFSGMDGKGNDLFIGVVIHRVFVKVDEEGSEAAASTAVAMKRSAIPVTNPVFRADHPFIFLIQENKTGSILFMGRVQNPGKSGG